MPDSIVRWRLWLEAQRLAALIRTHPAEVWYTYLASTLPTWPRGV